MTSPDPVHARLAELYSELSAAHRRLAEKNAVEYFDQWTSPLGTRLHCRLVRSGEISGHRAGKRLLVRADVMQAYLERNRVEPAQNSTAKAKPMDEFDQLLAKFGKKGKVRDGA